MKKFILKFSLFFGLLIIADIALGGVFNLYDFTKGGEIGKIHSIMTKETPDLVVMGSSRAVHHYDPTILEDSLGLKTYNAGFDGEGTTIAYGFLNGLARRKYPQIVICEITPAFDLYAGISPVSTNNFYPYVYDDTIKTIITDFHSTEKIKLISNSYRLNSSLLRLLPSVLLRRESTSNGYLPEYGVLYRDSKPKQHQSKKYEVDSIREKYLRKLIEQSQNNGCEVIFAISPIYGGADESFYDKEMGIVSEYSIPILNHLNDKRFIYNPSYFKDPTHLNNDGANLYTLIISQEIKNHLYNR